MCCIVVKLDFYAHRRERRSDMEVSAVQAGVRVRGRAHLPGALLLPLLCVLGGECRAQQAEESGSTATSRSQKSQCDHDWYVNKHIRLSIYALAF